MDADDLKIELEDQFIMRLPLLEAETIRNALKKKKPKKFKKLLKIQMNDDVRFGTVFVNKKPLNAVLYDLPTIIESNKMTDKVNLYKTADICQILICESEKNDINKLVAANKENLNSNFNANANNITSNVNNNKEMQSVDKKKFAFKHGMAPPLKNVRRFRFRKTLRNKNDIQESADIEKEVLMLLRMDNEAVNTRYEFFYEKEKAQKSSKECEKSIFGDLSDSDDSNSSEITENVIMDFTR